MSSMVLPRSSGEQLFRLQQILQRVTGKRYHKAKLGAEIEEISRLLNAYAKAIGSNHSIISH